MPYMYIVECADKSFYVGSTWDVEQRVWQHNHDGGAAYTRRRRPVRLVYFEEYESIAEAHGREKQVQGWGRAKRRALIDGIGDTVLPSLAKKRFQTPRSGTESAPPPPVE
ncbi:putative endonuclease [Microterricola gilva]|uniref:Putative endonuclease n=1 Tax=Microterricola gilva TaxID=393267 RepID=A0A4Q8ALF7_9MICO|nr:GIY-YIG nuclease family protein [Microterricola gilva]RZU64709.1 putative endonuclease [Microterricola gilva]